MNGVQLLLVVIAAIAVSALANRRGLQAPLLVVTVGLAVSFIPGLPRLELDPKIILSIVLPPLLYSTALEFSFISFARNLGPILRLGVGLVLFTAFVVGGVASSIVPQLSFGAAVVLGAVVAPPDAVTAVAIGRTLGVPRRVMTILTGESLVNDAAALTLFSLGIAAVTGTRSVLENPVLFFLYASATGVVIGVLVGVVVQLVRPRLKDPGLETVLGLSIPFVAYLLAEQMHASGVLAVVIAGFLVGHNSATAGYATRLQERQVWRSLDVLLETFVFAYMGLQLRFVIDDLVADGEHLDAVFAASLAVLLVVMLVRSAWVFTVYSQGVLIRRLGRRIGGRLGARLARRPDPGPPALTWKHSVVISWTGMRGVVTLAAAGGVPLRTADGSPFPGRASIQFIAFVVAVGTLLIQGSTLPGLVRWLNISTETEQKQQQLERRKATKISRKASKQAVTDLLSQPPVGVDPTLLAGVAERLRQAQDTRASYPGGEAEAPGAPRAPASARLRSELAAAVTLLRQRMITAQREALVRERDAGTLDDETVRELLEQLDYEEAATSGRLAQRL
jgi:monovalent cation/hydrogen antiporter